MKGPFLLVVLSIVSVFYSACGEQAAVKVEVQFDANLPHLFRVLVDGDAWFQSSHVFFRADNQIYSTEDNSATLLYRKETAGQDKLGAFVRHDLAFGANNTVQMIGSVKQYASSVVFEQSFPDGLRATSSGDADGLVTAWPTFAISEEQTVPQGFAHYISWIYDFNAAPSKRKLLVAPGFATPVFGAWTAATALPGGIGGTGVTAVYNSDASSCAVLGAMSGAMALSSVSPAPGSLQYGIMGNATAIPKGFTTQLLMAISNQGLTHSVMQFGEALRTVHGKPPAREARAADLTLRFLGFTTDNGAYYYYHTEADKDYEQTLLSVWQSAVAAALPIRYFLLDSWWYGKGSNGGVADWSAQPSIFPNGIAALTNATGMYIQAHNRYWALDNVYSDYAFVKDTVKQGAVPVDPAFWTDLLRAPSKDWKLAVYEQDWLFNEFYEYVSQFLEDVQLGKQWLQQMNDGAVANGVTIQYCMPFIRHLLQSVEMSAVTQARASDDYVVSPYQGVDNWRIGGQSLLIYSLGMLPSKDGFWSSSYQPGNPYGEERYEPYPRLQAAVTSLSGGPFAIADGIGYTDVDLVMRACDKDGRILFPSKPATSLDVTYARNALNGRTGAEVWAAQSFIPVFGHAADGHKLASFHSKQSVLTVSHLFAAGVTEAMELTPAMTGYDAHSALFVRENNATSGQIWSEAAPLRIAPCGLWDFQLFTASPIIGKSFALLGELDKWIAISAQRFAAVYVNEHANGELKPGDVTLLLRGAVDESITVAFMDVRTNALHKVTCTFRSTQMPDGWQEEDSKEYKDLPRTAYLSMQLSGACI